jgi:benzoyl-CoA reductase/2-hydroxyglutaryl-CoA dehydratase subunit BcrC/BadD/HgdB
VKNIAFTTSIPVEVIFAAGMSPIDINNIFINDNPANSVRSAEINRFPRNICSWIKGLYTVIQKNQIDTIIGVVAGDCSNTNSLMSILADEDRVIVPFSYPYDRDRDFLEIEIRKLETYFGVTRTKTNVIKAELDVIRKKLVYLDELTYKTNQVSSAENHYWLVSSSDFNRDYKLFDTQLDDFLQTVKSREPNSQAIRLGYVGVPPIISDLYSFLETCNARVVFNEVQRQFSMPTLQPDIVDTYLEFTYPYSIFSRITDIQNAIEMRQLDGLIAYTQSFCHRQLDILSLKKHIQIPILQLECDQPGKLDDRAKLRIESFLEMILFSE